METKDEVTKLEESLATCNRAFQDELDYSESVERERDELADRLEKIWYEHRKLGALMLYWFDEEGRTLIKSGVRDNGD